MAAAQVSRGEVEAGSMLSPYVAVALRAGWILGREEDKLAVSETAPRPAPFHPLFLLLLPLAKRVGPPVGITRQNRGGGEGGGGKKNAA